MLFRSLERERVQIEEDRAESDQYKQLLLKQRDIMVALTERLNERDETIIQLQEEIDAYDRIYKETEEAFDKKCARVDLLESILTNNKLKVPPPDEEDKFIERADIIQKRYAPYQRDTMTETTDSPLLLLTADEKIMELMDIIEKQKSLNGNNIGNSQIEAEVNKRLKIKSKELEMKEVELMKQHMELDSSTKMSKDYIANGIDDKMLLITNNALKELKEQKDQYRLYHIIQDVTTLQKMLLNLSNKFG